jgi:hypothetical protein
MFDSQTLHFFRDRDLWSGSAYYVVRSGAWLLDNQRQSGYTRAPNHGYWRDYALPAKFIEFEVDLDITDALKSSVQNTRNYLGRTKDRGILGNVQLTSRGEYTDLPLALVEALGTPLDLPVPASLTFTSSRTGIFNQTKMNVGAWVDRRGSFALIGSNYRDFVAAAGARKALTTRGFRFSMENNQEAEYALKYVNGSIAAKAGNWFLYRQDLQIRDPYSETEKTVKWVGLASCMSYQYFGRHKKNHCIIAALKNVAPPERERAMTPLHRWNRAPTNIQWDQESWQELANQDLTQFTTVATPELLEALSFAESLYTTPQGIKLQRMQEVRDTKKDELHVLRQQLSQAESQLENYREMIEQKINEIIRAKKALKEWEGQLPALQEEQARLAPQVQQRQQMLTKIQVGVHKKELEFEEMKLQYDLHPQGRSNYMAGLANSGLVIDEIYYKHKVTGETCRASRNTKLTVDRDYVMTKVEMHTTRPIPIHFGIEGQQPRMSGPHKLLCTNENGTAELYISSLAPWSAGGWTGTVYKPYPHVSGVHITDTSAAEVAKQIMAYQGKVCMGELAPAALNAFTNNNPKHLALAVLSYLQSVNPIDTWGKSYVDFPYANWADREIVDFEEWAASSGASTRLPWQNSKYFLSKDGLQYVELRINGSYCDVRYGDISYEDGSPKEITCSEQKRYVSSDTWHYPWDYPLRTWIQGLHQNPVIKPALAPASAPKAIWTIREAPRPAPSSTSSYSPVG